MVRVVSVAQEHNHVDVRPCLQAGEDVKSRISNMTEKITNQPNYWVRLKLYREMLERERGQDIAFKTLPKHVTDKRIRREIELRYKRKEREEML